MVYNAKSVYNAKGVYNGETVYNEGGGGPITDVLIGGKTYPVIQIGPLYWTTLNLDYIDDNIILGGTPTFDYVNAHAWYYQNDEYQFGWNGIKFGLLYNNLAVEYLETNKAALLNGFRVPKEADYQSLENEIGTTDFIKKLKSTNYWNTPGTNESGFSMVPGGACSGADYQPITWSDIYVQSNLRMITSDHLGKMFRANDDNSYILLRTANEAFGISVRLCKDV